MFLGFIERMELADISVSDVCWRDSQENVVWTWLNIIGLNDFLLESTLLLSFSPFVLLPPRLWHLP